MLCSGDKTKESILAFKEFSVTRDRCTKKKYMNSRPNISLIEADAGCKETEESNIVG